MKKSSYNNLIIRSLSTCVLLFKIGSIFTWWWSTSEAQIYAITFAFLTSLMKSKRVNNQ